MPRHTKRTHTKDDKGLRHRTVNTPPNEAEIRDEKNKARFVGPPGVLAQDLPDAKHGMNVVDSPKEIRRNLPHQHGGLIGEHEEGGMRGDRSIGAAARFGGRKKN